MAERVKDSAQNINDIEGKRCFPRLGTLARIAEALDVEVYQLFIPQDKIPVIIEETPENDLLRRQITEAVVADVRRVLSNALDKIK